MQTEWAGYYLDGKTAVRQPVNIRLLRTRLEIVVRSGEAVCWPYGEIRQTQGEYAGQEVRLERGGDLPEVLLIGDPAFLSSLHHLAPEAGARFHDPGRRRFRIAFTALAACAVLGVTAALYLWGIPGAASLVTPFVPTSWEERLGEAVSGHLAPAGARCTDAPRMQAIAEIADTLLAPVQQAPYRFRVAVTNNPSMNALAAPGGHIIVFRGLLEATQSPEELAGVLAHEFQHVLLRHSTRALLRYASTGLLVTAVTGDLSGATLFGLEGARLLGELRYSRQDEEEADREGLKMLLDAGIPAAGIIAFFERLDRSPGGSVKLPSYLSTHPSPGQRIARLRALAEPAPPGTTRLLPGRDWQEIRAICQATGPLSQ
jgi:predicted Zn-dependent protease